MAVERTLGHIRQGIDGGLHLGAQLCVVRNDEVVVDAAVGETRRGPGGAAMSPDSLLVWLSSSKPVTAVAIAQLVEEELVTLDDPAAYFIPEFAAHGKGRISLRHLLTHTSGMKHVPLPGDWNGAIERLCDAPLEAEPGTLARYSGTAGWYVLGEVVQRASGRPFSEYVRERIFEPLGMGDCWFGMSHERYDAYGQRMAILYRATADGLEPAGVGSRRHLLEPIPGANAAGPMRQLARFYRALLHGGELGGTRILEPESVELFTDVHRHGMMDHSFRYPMVWGLGFIRQDPDRKGRMPYGYGRHASNETFGHSGMESSVAFADPAHDLVVTLAFNGMPGEREHQRRVDAALTTLYEELGLVD